MSEQYPLLYDDLSEEERFSPRFHRRLLMSRTRARNHVKGAAALIARWPDHWTTLLNYWWIGIGMITLTTYIIYNCLFAYATFQPTNKFHHKPVTFKTLKLIPNTSLPSKVFMHIFVDDTTQEVDLNNYLPYIEILTNKHKHFYYELIIVANDTKMGTENLSDKENNELALNLLWNGDFDNKQILTSNSNVNVQYVTLSDYLQDSPVQKFWKTLPQQFIKFLVRAFSIWEKGGIAFDPIILTPQSPNSVYFSKINDILRKHAIKKEKVKFSHKSFKQYMPSKKINKYKQEPNNIRDIINAIENEGVTEKPYQEPLAEAESKDNFTAIFQRQLRSVGDTDVYKEDINDVITKPIILTETLNDTANEAKLHKETSNKRITDEIKPDSPKLNLLPLFLNYLFHNKQTTTISETKQDNQPKGIVKSYENKSLQVKDVTSEVEDRKSYKPMIISAKGIFDQSKDNATKLAEVVGGEVENLFEVTIDLKGNIIATDTACHAFIGNIFSDAIHHDQSESLTDFVIKELSVFCKGLLASCVGIDVILL